jgi:hypothetical protein
MNIYTHTHTHTHEDVCGGWEIEMVCVRERER